MADIKNIGICTGGGDCPGLNAVIRAAVKCSVLKYRWMALALTLSCLFAVAAFAHPGSGIVVDGQGQVYFIDTGAGVWKIDTHGTLARHPGPAFHWMAMDADNRFRNARMPSGPGWEIDVAGANPTLLLSSDYPVALGRDGNLYYPLPGPGSRLQVVRLTPAGQTSVLATLPAQASGQPLRWLNGLAAGPDGSFYYTENNAIRRISAQGRISTVVADITVAGCAQIPGTESERPLLRGLDIDQSGTIYVTASGCGSVLKVTPAGKVSTLVQLQSPWSPTGVVVFGSDLYVLEYLHTASDNRREWLPRIRKLSPGGKSAVIASVKRGPA
ncbi:MAG: hypothetical protein ACRD3A_11410 [Terriglobales bacterium]